MTQAILTPDVQTLYRAHHSWLLGLLRRRLGAHEPAADLAQDTFVRLLTSRGAGPLREPRAYLNTVATRLTIQYFRRQAVERAYLESLASQPGQTAPSPEDRLLVIEALCAISAVLDQLPARTREIFLLSQLDGLTYPEIGRRLGLTVNVVQKAMGTAFVHCHDAVYR